MTSPDLGAEYSTELVARVAIRLLAREKAWRNDTRAFLRAAQQACRFLDACREVAEAHRRESYGLLDEPELGQSKPFLKVLRNIGRPGHSLKKTRELYRQFVRDDLSSGPTLEPLSESALDAAVKARIEQQELSGIREGRLSILKTEFENWYKDKVRRERSRAGGKGGRSTASKRGRSR